MHLDPMLRQEAIAQQFFTYLTLPSYPEREAYLNQYADLLLTPELDDIVAELLVNNADNPNAIALVHHHHTIVRSCRLDGLEATFAIIYAEEERRQMAQLREEEKKMLIDFSPIFNKAMNYSELAQNVTKAQLVATTQASCAFLRSILDGLTDAQILFDPIDPHANDPFAKEGEENIGWSIAHLIAHVTASSEEGAAYSSILARGIALEPRLRYETDWKEITTVAQCYQRVEESERMRLAYLEAWPDQPHLDVYRIISPRFEALVGRLNAVGAYLLGLGHEVEHQAQFEDVKRQATGG